MTDRLTPRDRIIGILILLLILTAIVAIVTLPVEAQPRQDTYYKLYVPFVTATGVLVDDLRINKPETCMAWSPGHLVAQSRVDFDTQFFYHSASHRPNWYTQGGIPVWRSSVHPDGFLNVGASLYNDRYSGLVLLFNEPDITGQDGPLSPQDAAYLYRLATRLLPAATFITPNANSVEYLQQFMGYVGDAWRPQDIIGIHMWQPPTGQTDGEYIFEYPTIWPDEWLAPVYVLADTYDAEVWVSEVGITTTWTPADQLLYVQQLDAPQVQAVCWFTTHCEDYTAHACLHNLYTDATGTQLSATGYLLQGVLRNTAVD